MRAFKAKENEYTEIKKKKMELHVQKVPYLCHQAHTTKLPSVIIISDQTVTWGFVQLVRLYRTTGVPDLVSRDCS